LLVFLVTAPVASVALWSISHTVTRFFDPCVTWGHPADQPVFLHVGRNDPCRAPSVESESRMRAAMIAALVPGGLLAASLFAMAGALLWRRGMMRAAAAGMLAETFVVFTIAPLTLITGISLLMLSKRLQPSA
jgi:hypothetical protein